MSAQFNNRIAQLLISAMVVLVAILGLFRGITSDEFQLGILALEMNRGRELYTELWDNHGPIPAWFMALVFQVWPFQDYNQWYIIRLAGLLSAFGCLGCVWLGLRELYKSRWARCLGLLTYLTFPAIQLKCYELRSDLFLQLVWSVMVLVWIYSTRRTAGAKWRGLGSLAIGLLAGIAFGFSLKALFLCCAIGIGTLIVGLKQRSHFCSILGYIFGGLLGLMVWLVPLAQTNRLATFQALFIEKNINRTPPPFFQGVQKFFDWSNMNALLVFLLMLILLCSAVRFYRRGETRILGVGSMAFLLLYAYCFVLPTFHAQSLLTLAVPLALVSPKLFLKLNAFVRLKIQKPVVISLLPVSTLLLIVASGIFTKDLFRLNMPEQVAWQNARRDAIPLDEPVFDGYGHPMTHNHPLYYTSWVETLRQSQTEGTLPQNLSEELQRHKIRWVIRDKRVQDLDESFNNWLRANYTPTPLEELMQLSTDAVSFD